MVIGVKELLERIRKNYNSINVILIQRERIWAMATLHSQLPDGMPHTPSPEDRLPKMIDRINRLTDRYRQLMDQFITDQEVAEEIYAKLDPRHANALRCYYSMAMTWEEAGKACGYSPDWTRHLATVGIHKAEESFSHGVKLDRKKPHNL